VTPDSLPDFRIVRLSAE